MKAWYPKFIKGIGMIIEPYSTTSLEFMPDVGYLTLFLYHIVRIIFHSKSLIAYYILFTAYWLGEQISTLSSPNT